MMFWWYLTVGSQLVGPFFSVPTVAAVFWQALSQSPLSAAAPVTLYRFDGGQWMHTVVSPGVVPSAMPTLSA